MPISDEETFRASFRARLGKDGAHPAVAAERNQANGSEAFSSAGTECLLLEFHTGVILVAVLENRLREGVVGHFMLLPRW